MLSSKAANRRIYNVIADSFGQCSILEFQRLEGFSVDVAA